jgi:DNA-binding GntR family transcriptional regulator
MAVQQHQRDRAYQYILNAVVTGKFAPGTWLSHRALAEEIGTSFIPVREAITQLVSEGLISHQPGVGSFVAQFSRQELAELYDLREAIEAHAIEKAAEIITEESLQQLEKHHEAMQAVTEAYGKSSTWTAGMSDCSVQNDAAFHLVILRAAGNGRAIKVIGNLQVMSRIFGHRNSGRPLSDLQQMCDTHAAIIDALRRRDAAKARELLVAHIRLGCQTALQAFDNYRLSMEGAQSSNLAFPEELQKLLRSMEASD